MIKQIEEVKLKHGDVVFQTLIPGSYLDLEWVATELKAAIQNIIQTHAMTNVEFGFRLRVGDPKGIACFLIRLNKQRGEAEEMWSVDFAQKCLHSIHELEIAVKRIMLSFEEHEKAHGIKDNDQIKPTEIKTKGK